MTRACWRCVEPIEDTATRCPSCGVRVVPVSSEPSPAETARKIRRGFALLLAIFVVIVVVVLVKA